MRLRKISQGEKCVTSNILDVNEKRKEDEI